MSNVKRGSIVKCGISNAGIPQDYFKLPHLLLNHMFPNRLSFKQHYYGLQDQM